MTIPCTRFKRSTNGNNHPTTSESHHMDFETSETTDMEQDLSVPVTEKASAFLSPRLRKWLIRSAVAIAILIAVAIAGITAYSKLVPSLPTVSLQDPSPETLVNSTPPITASELAAQVPETDRYPVEADPNHQSVASNQNIPDTQSPSPTVPTSELSELIQQLNFALQRADDATLYLETRVSALEKNLEGMKSVDHRLEELTGEVSSLQANTRKLYGLIETFNAPPPASASVTPAAISLVPPFTLIAIDRWQSEWNAVLEMQGKTAMIKPNDERAGWRLVKIEPTARRALFRNRDGIDHELEITR